MPAYTVLLVEDSEFLSSHVSETLAEEHGFEVRCIGSAAETRDVLADASDAVDCVISSYELPDETGIELAASVTGDSKMADVPFVLFTGNPLEPLSAEALEAGVSAFVQKSNHASGEMNVFANRVRLAIEANR
ncbi:response regulator [Natrarchaeobaculum aegyptiacum]|uniref:Response regulator n=1 Tax=Natrarchaeobaculum aegyptiacum TaxID=745377 RepID=A0A2Z2HST8_9EURY|nr:response regulator [Natrarchaeobaculum aegyptiacum]ARS90219.1 response regulator [Natrarchaeobaculum aegyptiacum]